MLVQDASFAKLPRAAPYEFESRLEAMPPLTGDVRADFNALRGYVEAVHLAGGSGRTVVRLLSAAMDRIVAAIWERSLASAAKSHPPRPWPWWRWEGTGGASSPPTATWTSWSSTRSGSPDRT